MSKSRVEEIEEQQTKAKKIETALPRPGETQTIESPLTDAERAKKAESVFPQSAETSEQVRTALAAPSDGGDRAVAPEPLRQTGLPGAQFDPVLRVNTAIQAMAALLANPNVTNGTTLAGDWKQIVVAAWRAADALYDAEPPTPKERHQ
jgi:hypothetical protein